MRSSFLRRAACIAFGAACITAVSCQSPLGSLGGDRNTQQIPADWVGIWEVHVQNRLCIPDSVILEETHIDTVCGNSTVGEEFNFNELLSNDAFDLGLLCSATSPELTGNTITFSCAGGITLGGCQNSATTNVVLTLDPDTHTYTGTGNVTVDVEPNDATCGPDRCFNFAITATRLSASSPGCEATKP
jgi:hypothetical protein